MIKINSFKEKDSVILNNLFEQNITNIKLATQIKFYADKAYDQYELIGLRFENKKRQKGETCGTSKDNPDREDEREFPAYGTKEYENLPALNGCSCWNLIDSYGKILELEGILDYFTNSWSDPNDKIAVDADHAYIIVGDIEGYHPNPDPNEIIIIDGIVFKILF